MNKHIEALELYQKTADAFYELCEKEKVGLTEGRKKFRADVKEAVDEAIKALRAMEEAKDTLTKNWERIFHLKSQLAELGAYLGKIDTSRE